MSNLKHILRLSITLLLITAFIAAALAGVNAITEDRIAAIQADKTQKAIGQVLTFEGEAVLLENTPEKVNGVTITAVYETSAGYAVQVEPAGFGGGINMMVGVDFEGKVTGISIISHAETAGLGAVAAADTGAGEAFRGQFVGQSGQLSVTKDGGTIDAISSSTITSRAVTEGVNAAIACASQLKGGQ